MFTVTMYAGISNGKKKKPEKQGKDGDEVDSSLVATLIVEDVKTNHWSTKETRFYCQPCR